MGYALKLFIRFAITKGVVIYGLELMMALFESAPVPLFAFAGEPTQQIGEIFNLFKKCY